jgi:glutathione synthase/RimK-type ligase-like ATP-grasp enzyme
MKIAVIYDPKLDVAKTWVNWLSQAGYQLDTFYEMPKDWKTRPAQNYDLILPLISIRDYSEHSNGYNHRFAMAQKLEKQGLQLLNSTQSIINSSDKLIAAQLWQKANLLHPKVYNLSNQKTWPLPGQPHRHQGQAVRVHVQRPATRRQCLALYRLP